MTSVMSVETPISHLDPYSDRALIDPWPTYVSKALHDPSSFPSSLGVMMNDHMNHVLRGNTLCSDGEDHRRLRRIIMKPLTPSALKSLQERVTVEADELESSEAFALMRGMVPPGVAIPLHNHADPEVLFVLEGEPNVLQYEGDSSHWVTTRPGEIVCIPGDVRHALRNTSPATVTLLLTTTPNIYCFFRELGKPFHPDQPLGPPTPQDMQRLRDLASQHNYWMASPEENAAIGLSGF